MERKEDWWAKTKKIYEQLSQEEEMQSLDDKEKSERTSEPVENSSEKEGKDQRGQGKAPSKDKKTFAAKASRFKLEKDVVLSAETRLQFDECLAKLKYHDIIYSDWNFQSVDPLGKSTILNFYGPPGTGKTMAAEALAGELGLQYIHIGIAEIESKFMGESSLNIQAAFDAARETGALLFFDEADTLLGKRLSSVTQGVDNETNAMRSTLLIELERFDGIAVFATNFAENYDEAFRSRITQHVHFTLPDLNARKALFERMLVPKIPLEQERDEFINYCAEISEGLAGREIRTCLRLSLPKALMESEGSIDEAALKQVHIQSAVDEINESKKHVASGRKAKLTRDEAKTAKNLLGIKEKEEV